MNSSASPDQRIQALQEIFKGILKCDKKYFASYRPRSNYQKATYAMYRRGLTLLKGTHVLISTGLMLESAILFRSLMNLFWIFVFLTGGKKINDQWQFKDGTDANSPESMRADRFLGWKWVILYRQGIIARNVVRRYQDFKRKCGYESNEKIPREWYQEKSSKVSTIKDIAVHIGAKEQYEKDYKILSGIEHGDATTEILWRFQFGQPRIGIYFIFAKAIQFVALITNCCIPISGSSLDEETTELFERLDGNIKAIYEELSKSTPKQARKIPICSNSQ